jgi:hypothetical protein
LKYLNKLESFIGVSIDETSVRINLEGD